MDIKELKRTEKERMSNGDSHSGEENGRIEHGFKTFFLCCCMYALTEISIAIGTIYALTDEYSKNSSEEIAKEWSIWVSELIGYAVFARSIVFIFCMISIMSLCVRVYTELKTMYD